MEEHHLVSELRAIQIRLDFLSSVVAELKIHNEERRASIDAVANSMRHDQHVCVEKWSAAVESLKNEIEKLKIEISITRWIGIIIGGTALTLTTIKLLDTEAHSVPTNPKPPIERLVK